MQRMRAHEATACKQQPQQPQQHLDQWLQPPQVRDGIESRVNGRQRRKWGRPKGGAWCILPRVVLGVSASRAVFPGVITDRNRSVLADVAALQRGCNQPPMDAHTHLRASHAHNRQHGWPSTSRGVLRGPPGLAAPFIIFSRGGPEGGACPSGFDTCQAAARAARPPGGSAGARRPGVSAVGALLRPQTGA